MKPSYNMCSEPSVVGATRVCIFGNLFWNIMLLLMKQHMQEVSNTLNGLSYGVKQQYINLSLTVQNSTAYNSLTGDHNTSFDVHSITSLES